MKTKKIYKKGLAEKEDKAAHMQDNYKLNFLKERGLLYG